MWDSAAPRQDLAVRSQVFFVIFYIKIPVEKRIRHFFYIFFTFSFQDIVCLKKNHFLKSEKNHINLIKYI